MNCFVLAAKYSNDLSQNKREMHDISHRIANKGG